MYLLIIIIRALSFGSALKTKKCKTAGEIFTLAESNKIKINRRNIILDQMRSDHILFYFYDAEIFEDCLVIYAIFNLNKFRGSLKIYKTRSCFLFFQQENPENLCN